MKHALASLAVVITLLPAMALAQDARVTVDRPGHREWAWDGGEKLGVGGAMTVRVVPGGPARVVMTGPEELVRAAYLRRGDLGLEQSSWWSSPWRDRGRIEVTVSGVNLSEVSVSGSSRVTLENAVRQRDLTVRVSGSGQVEARGEVERLEARVSGSGDVRLVGITAQQGDISVSGSGNVEVGAVAVVDASVSGSGDVRIRQRPKNIETSISGSGRVTAGGDTYTRRNRH